MLHTFLMLFPLPILNITDNVFNVILIIVVRRNCDRSVYIIGTKIILSAH